MERSLFVFNSLNKCGCSAPSFTSSVTLRLVTAYVAIPLVDWGDGYSSTAVVTE
jgi:hypothetical protein